MGAYVSLWRICMCIRIIYLITFSLPRQLVLSILIIALSLSLSLFRSLALSRSLSRSLARIPFHIYTRIRTHTNLRTYTCTRPLSLSLVRFRSVVIAQR